MHCAFSWFSLLQLNETLLKKNLTYAAEYFPQWRRHVRGKYICGTQFIIKIQEPVQTSTVELDFRKFVNVALSDSATK